MLGYTTPSAQCMLGYDQQAGGMHLTGLHSCSVYFFGFGRKINKIFYVEISVGCTDPRVGGDQQTFRKKKKLNEIELSGEPSLDPPMHFM